MVDLMGATYVCSCWRNCWVNQSCSDARLFSRSSPSSCVQFMENVVNWDGKWVRKEACNGNDHTNSHSLPSLLSLSLSLSLSLLFPPSTFYSVINEGITVGYKSSFLDGVRRLLLHTCILAHTQFPRTAPPITHHALTIFPSPHTQ